MKAHELKAAMARIGSAPMRGDDDFWSDFRARARLYPQIEPAPQSALPRAAPWMAAACAGALLAVLVFLPFGGKPAQASEILTVDVLARHSAFMIMNEDASGGTILWICDMESEPGGDST